MKALFISFFIALTLVSCGQQEHPDRLRIAVASNFQVPMTALVNRFKEGHPSVDISISSASSGVLLSQIKQGAPFDLFFSADSERPMALAKEYGLESHVYTYAVGQLVLWVPESKNVNLHSFEQISQKVAIAQPELAPYGLATKQVLEKYRIWQKLRDKLVYGNNVAQVEYFVKTGAVGAGFVSLAQAKHANVDMQHIWIIPKDDYAPLEQKVIQLNGQTDLKLGRQFLDFVLSAQGQSIIEQLGYGVVYAQRDLS